MWSHRSAISSGMGYLQAAMAPAIAPMVSESPPREMARRMTSSKEFPSMKAIIASGALPWQDTSNPYLGRISAIVRCRL